MHKARSTSTRIRLGMLYGVLAVAAAAMVIHGLVNGPPAWAMGGALGLIVVLATAPIAMLLPGLGARGGGSRGMSAQMERAEQCLARIQEHSMLSDNAKRVLFRDREVQMLRDAIEDDIARGDYNAAITLCDEMANLFGYREEAEAFRSTIVQVRQEQYEHQVHAAIEKLEADLSQRNWSGVHQQAARIRRLYPDSHLVTGLDQRIHQAREEHKNELETQFLQEAQRGDVEAAMALLKQLDLYLGREEAGRLTQVAQQVIVRHRDNLGAQFRMAVNEHRWAEAAQLGEKIVSEFPNSKMADEVRSMIDVLRSRAGREVVVEEGLGA